MKKAFSPSCLSVCSTLILFAVLAFSPTPDADDKEQQLISKANQFNMRFPQEKIYLHLDRSSYWASEDIWFKAYLENSPIRENNLYVELINSKGAVIYKNLCWAQQGLAYGDIHLADTLSSGVYQIRAYTNWLRNFDDAWFFRKNVVIWNLRDKQANEESNNLKTREVDLQFFPEGGTLISGLKNKVAFKATDKNGKGLTIEGEITDDQGTKIIEFKSQFKGMGSFVFEPQDGRKYSADVLVAGQIRQKADLPVARQEGVILSFDSHDTTLVRLKIAHRFTDARSANDYFIVGQSDGEVCFQKKLTIQGTSDMLEIKKSALPTGIVKFTLFDDKMIPHCERLVYINNHDNVNLQIIPGQLDYTTRERADIQVRAFARTGNPCRTNLSVSVYNPETDLGTEDYPDNILTHFLLDSELRGTIEDPAWYFKDDSLSTLAALDNLMLTHGYRHFGWKEIVEEKFPEITYQPVGCIQLKGKVKSTIRQRPVPNAKVTMMTVKSLLGVYTENTDSLGRFLFSDLFFNDTVYVSLQALNQKGNRNNDIEIDETTSISPKANFLPVAYQYDNQEPLKTISYLSELSSELINKKWRLSDTILLGDINVVTKKMKSNDELVRMYADADYVVKVSKEDALYTNVVEMMDSKPYLRMFTDAEFYLNGAPVDRDFLESLPVNGFDKVEVVKFSPLIKGGGPAVFFYLKRGAPQYVPSDVFGMKSYAIIGYSVIREFYSPSYDTAEDQPEQKDYRSTIYWNPVVQTDSTGITNISFYNSDQVGEVHLIVEGISSDGKLCRGVSKYHVTH